MNDGPKNKSAQASWPRTVTWLLFVVGLGSLVVLLWRMGLGEITTQLTAVGWKLPLVVLPYIVVAIFDALGWWFAFPSGPYPFGFFDLFRLRLAAKAINDVTPTFSMAGELAKVPGVGPTKLERYAEPVLSVLAGGDPEPVQVD